MQLLQSCGLGFQHDRQKTPYQQNAFHAFKELLIIPHQLQPGREALVSALCHFACLRVSSYQVQQANFLCAFSVSPKTS